MTVASVAEAEGWGKRELRGGALLKVEPSNKNAKKKKKTTHPPGAKTMVFWHFEQKDIPRERKKKNNDYFQQYEKGTRVLRTSAEFGPAAESI